jgi:hypothetical protein
MAFVRPQFLVWNFDRWRRRGGQGRKRLDCQFTKRCRPFQEVYWIVNVFSAIANF